MFSVRNELKANLLQDNAGDNCFPAEPITSLGYNVSSDGTCAMAAAGDLLNAAATLGPLQDNGGPTPTHALTAGPGLDHVPAAICPAPATDQRGVARAQGAACESGAYEFVPPPAPTINQLLATLLNLAVDVEPDYGLHAFVRTAQQAVAEDRPQDACAALALLQAQVDRKSDKPGRVKLSAEQAAAITAANAAARAALGCS